MTKYQKESNRQISSLKNLPPLPDTSVVAFDPGGTTGYFNFEQDGVEPEWGQLSFEEMLDLCSSPGSGAWKLPKIWVVETYQIYPWKANDLSFDECIPAQIIGMLRVAAIQNNARLVMQTAQVAKGFSTDKRLEAYFPTINLRDKNRHARDATRHALYYLLVGITKDAEFRTGQPATNNEEGKED